MLDSDLYRQIQDYISGDKSLFDLQDWITSRTEQWASLPKSDPAARATGSIMLAVYELDAGDRDERSVRKIARDALTDLQATQQRA